MVTSVITNAKDPPRSIVCTNHDHGLQSHRPSFEHQSPDFLASDDFQRRLANAGGKRELIVKALTNYRKLANTELQ